MFLQMLYSYEIYPDSTSIKMSFKETFYRICNLLKTFKSIRINLKNKCVREWLSCKTTGYWDTFHEFKSRSGSDELNGQETKNYQFPLSVLMHRKELFVTYCI